MKFKTRHEAMKTVCVFMAADFKTLYHVHQLIIESPFPVLLYGFHCRPNSLQRVLADVEKFSFLYDLIHSYNLLQNSCGTPELTFFFKKHILAGK